MVWHIFRKDCKLMWRAAAVVAALELAYALIRLQGEFGRGNGVLDQFSTVLTMLWLVGSVILIVMVVQQDALPGTKQDWLTRPIRRRDMMLAKLLFAMLAVQGATVMGDLIQGLGSGFSLRQSLSAALARAAIGFAIITLPALALGALTDGIAEAMVLTAVLCGAIFLFMFMAVTLDGGNGQWFDATNMTGVEWLTNTLRYGLVLLGAGVVLVEQYRMRRTAHGRVVMASALVVVLLSQLTPWRPVFAVEKRLSPGRDAASGIAMEWGGKSGTSALGAPEGAVSGSGAGRGFGGVSQEESRLVFPLRVSGVPQDAVLKEDKAEVTLTDASGKRVFRGDGGDVEIRTEGGAAEPVDYAEAVRVPAPMFHQNQDREVRAETNYSMTLFALKATYTIAAEDGDQFLPGWGRCRTRINGAATAVEMFCMQMGVGPTCATVFLEDPRDGTRNRPNTTCSPNYSPYVGRPIPDATARFRLVLPFRDAAGLTAYAVDGSRVGGARVVIRLYEPREHFTRTVASPVMALREMAQR